MYVFLFGDEGERTSPESLKMQLKGRMANMGGLTDERESLGTDRDVMAWSHFLALWINHLSEAALA